MADKIFVNFKEKREFDGLFNATFRFIKQEFKPLMKALLILAGPFIVFNSLILGVFQYTTFQSGYQPGFYTISALLLEYFFAYLMVSIILITTNVYIKLYIEQGHNVSFKEISSNLKNKFLRGLGAIFLVGLLIGISSVLFLFPGIYLSVAFSMFLIIIIYENAKISYSLSRSMELIKGAWWKTFVAIIIIGIISYVIMIVFSLPFIIFFNTVAFGGFIAGPFSAGLSSFLIFIFYIIFFSGTFALVIPEEKNGK